MRTITNRATLQIICRALNDAAKDGKLTSGGFGEAIDAIDGSGPVPTSVGLAWLDDWLLRNSSTTALPWVGIDICQLFRQRLHNPHIVSVLRSERLFHLIRQSARAGFVRAVLIRYLPQGVSWVENVRNAGVSNALLVEAILIGLRSPSPSQAENADVFLAGPGRICYATCEQNPDEEHRHLADANLTLWSIFPDDGFMEAMRCCAAIMPDRFLEDDELINLLEARLHQRPDCAQLLSDIICLAARCTHGRDTPIVEVLSRLTSQHKLLLLRAFEGYSLPFLVYMASQLQHGRALFDQFATKLCEASSSTYLYRYFCAAQTHLASMADRELAVHIDEVLVAALARRGFYVGHLTIKGHKGFSRYQVVVDDVVYLQTDDSSEALTEGDRVIFKPDETDTRTRQYVMFHVLDRW